ncbi:hypothetical protein VZT92_024393 [Zoarces viviparus]|uniref:DUF3715 domain-containing protein n=1 Tax=Zoarces viviparus TaxID=48416 RepID=A0AAW1E1U1_ZOAVI
MESGNGGASSKGVLVPVSERSDVFQSSILAPLKSAYLYEESRQSFRYKSAVLVKNAALEEKYNAFREKRRKVGYSEEELKESYGFLVFEDINQANALSETGVLTGNSTCTTLGDPSKGVYISMYSDCLDLNRWYHGKSGYIAIIRLSKGRVKQVLENYTQNFTAPTVGFDCHVSEQLPSVSPKTSSFLAFERTQYYMYELLDDGSNVTIQSPSAACPIAIVSFSYTDTKATLEAPQEKSEEKKLVRQYFPWRGQLQIGPQVYDVGLRSTAGALIPVALPPVVKIERAISMFNLRQLLPRAAFETCFSGEVFLDGLYCSLCELVSSEVEETRSLSLLLQEIKEKDLALTIQLNDGGFLILLHSTHFLTYDDTGSSVTDVLQGMFVFPNSQVIQRDTKFREKKLAISSEILHVLPVLSYAEGEVEKTPIDPSEELCEVLAQHMQTYASLINPGLASSPTREVSIFPDQYDVPDAHKHLYSSPEWTNKAWQSFRSYLSKPESFQLPLSKASEILAAGQEERMEDFDDDVYICLSSPEGPPAKPVGIESEDQLTGQTSPVNSETPADTCKTNVGSEVDLKTVPQNVVPDDVQAGEAKDTSKSNLSVLIKADDTGTKNLLTPSISDDLPAELIVSITSAEQTVTGLTPRETVDKIQKTDGRDTQPEQTILDKQPQILHRPSPIFARRGRIKTLKKHQGISTEYVKKKWWLHFQTPACYASEKLKFKEYTRDNSVRKTVKEKINSACSSTDALSLLADLALGASNDQVPPQPDPALERKTETSLKNCDLSKDLTSPEQESVLHSLLRQPAARSMQPLESTSPNPLVEGNEWVGLVSKEHAYSLPPSSSLLLGLPGTPFPVSPLSGSTRLLRHHQTMYGNGIKTLHPSVGQEDSSEQNQRTPEYLKKHMVRRRKFRQSRTFVNKDGSIQVTKQWKEDYDFNLDSKFTNDSKDRTIVRALHGPWDFSLQDTNEEVRLIVHMWIGLFYSRSTDRFFHVDSYPCSEESDSLDVPSGMVSAPAQSELKANSFAPFPSITDTLISKVLDFTKKDDSMLDQGSGILDLSLRKSNAEIVSPDTQVNKKETSVSIDRKEASETLNALESSVGPQEAIAKQHSRKMVQSREIINEMNDVRSADENKRTCTPLQKAGSLEHTNVPYCKGDGTTISVREEMERVSVQPENNQKASGISPVLHGCNNKKMDIKDGIENSEATEMSSVQKHGMDSSKSVTDEEVDSNREADFNDLSLGPQSSLTCTVHNNPQKRSSSFLEQVSQRCIQDDLTEASMEQECLIFSERMKHLMKRTKRGPISQQDTHDKLNLPCTSPLTVHFCSLEEQDDSVDHLTTHLDAPLLVGQKIKVDMSERIDLADSTEEEKTLRLQNISQRAGNPMEHAGVSGVTSECARLYKARMKDVCAVKKVPSRSKHFRMDRGYPKTEPGNHFDFCDQMKRELDKSFRSNLNSVVKKSCKTKYRFYILVTSEDAFFEETKAQLEAEGHTAVQPSQFFLDEDSSSSLLIILKNEDIAEHICEVPHLVKLKTSPGVQFAGIDEPDDVVNLTHQELFTRGGFIMFDSAALETLSLCNMKKMSEILQERSRTGRWKWMMHYRDSRRLKENARLSKEAKDKKLFLNLCQEAGILEVLPYHECDLMSRDLPDYLTCLVRLQVQSISARYPIFITDTTTDNAFGKNGILTMTLQSFLTSSPSETFTA